jgi:hypothetical protein
MKLSVVRNLGRFRPLELENAVGTEATAFEYAMGLFSVLIGLAVVDVATSFHRLARVRRSIKWDPLTLVVAIYTLCMAVYMWFDLWGVRHFAAARQFIVYLSLVALFFVLYLAAAASLPDDANATTNLRDYYEGNRRYFWTLVAVFQALYTAFGFFLFFTASEASGNDFEPGRPWVAAALLTLMALPTIVSAVLIFLKSRVVHYVGVGMLFALMLIHYAQAQIG